MRFLKKYRVILFLITMFILGFLTMPLFHGGYFGVVLRSYTGIAWYYHLLLFIGLFLLTLALHEVAHFVSFLMSGYENEALIILFFVFYKKDGKWRIGVNFRLLLLMGGLVFPNLGTIESDEDFVKARDAMRKSLLVAPMFTLISGVLIFFVTMIFFYHVSWLVVISLYTFIFSLLYTFVSYQENNQMFGDFKAYQRVKVDDAFAFKVILQYTSEYSDYQINFIRDYLDKELYSDDAMIYLHLLLDRFIFNSDTFDFYLFEKMTSYIHEDFRFINAIHSNAGLEFAQMIIFYADKIGYRDRALILKEKLFHHLDISKYREIIKTYIKKQTNHLLDLEDNSAYINDVKNIASNPLYFIISSIPSFVSAELERNEGYGKLPLECEIEDLTKSP